MQAYLDPGRDRPTLIMVENICYSHAADLEGNPLDLKMSIISARHRPGGRGNPAPKAPAILWLNGCGWRTPEGLWSMMVPELTFLADSGYIVACVQYRTSDQGKFPAQIVDVKTAIRFLRANSEMYGVDPDRIGVFGRSAGGHLASLAAMNTRDFLSEEWEEYSSDVQAACDMFGPADLTLTIAHSLEKLDDPQYRWHRMEDTYDAMLLGWEGSTDRLMEKAKIASPINYINDGMCDILIMHGEEDGTVPLSVSEKFYSQLVKQDREDHADFYVLRHGGHGTPEFYQESVRRILLRFFDRHLKD